MLGHISISLLLKPSNYKKEHLTPITVKGRRVSVITKNKGSENIWYNYKRAKLDV